MASDPITSWQIEGGKVWTVADFIFLDSQIIVDGDCHLFISFPLLLLISFLDFQFLLVWKTCVSLCFSLGLPYMKLCASRIWVDISFPLLGRFSFIIFWNSFSGPDILSSVQFRPVAQSCPTLCHPKNHSMPGLPVHHQLPEFTQTHVHRVSDAIQPSHTLSSPSPPALNPSQHQCLFQWVSSSHEVAKVLEFQL